MQLCAVTPSFWATVGLDLSRGRGQGLFGDVVLRVAMLLALHVVRMPLGHEHGAQEESL